MAVHQQYENYSKPVPMVTFGAGSQRKQKKSELGLSVLEDKGSEENILPERGVFGIASNYLSSIYIKRLVIVL